MESSHEDGFGLLLWDAAGDDGGLLPVGEGFVRATTLELVDDRLLSLLTLASRATEGTRARMSAIPLISDCFAAEGMGRDDTFIASSRVIRRDFGRRGGGASPRAVLARKVEYSGNDLR